MPEKSQFYTLVGYRLREESNLTEAMEDYIEMLYRDSFEQKEITVKDLSNQLNVKPSSVSKMVERLKVKGYIEARKYGTIKLTDAGIKVGNYLLWRHQILEDFFKIINGIDYKLEVVEKIEHFLDPLTLKNLEKWMNENK